MGKLILRATSQNLAKAYIKVLEYYGVDYEVFTPEPYYSKKSWHVDNYLIADVSKVEEQMVLHDIHELKKPNILRRSAIRGAEYLKTINARDYGLQF